MSGDDNSVSVVNVSAFSKPVNTFIEVISKGTGAVLKPGLIKRTAKAEGQAEIIKAEADVQAAKIRAFGEDDLKSELEQRAIDRLIAQEARKQENIESITEQAIPLIEENAKTENLEEDWVAHFFKQCDTVSDAEMQSLWAKLLAGEANSAGTFSKRTVNFVASLDKKDAKLFTKLVQFCWKDIGGHVPFIYDYNDLAVLTSGINFTTLSHLDSLGLIKLNMSGDFMANTIQRRLYIYYCGHPTVLELKGDQAVLLLGKAMLTQMGQELASLCTPKMNADFYYSTIRHRAEKGIVTHSPCLEPRFAV